MIAAESSIWRLTAKLSQMPAAAGSSGSPVWMSRPTLGEPLASCSSSLSIVSCASYPAFSASVFGIVSSASAYACTPSFARPETLAHQHLVKFKSKVNGRAKLGVQAFAEAVLTIPKTLAENAGYDAQDTSLKLLEQAEAGSAKIGLDITTGEPIDPCAAGLYDNYVVKRQMLDSAAVISSQLLLVDEVIKAGKQMKKG